MNWTAPTLHECAVGLEATGYYSPDETAGK